MGTRLRAARAVRERVADFGLIVARLPSYAAAITMASHGRNYIETVWGRGYVLREPTAADDRITA